MGPWCIDFQVGKVLQLLALLNPFDLRAHELESKSKSIVYIVYSFWILFSRFYYKPLQLGKHDYQQVFPQKNIKDETFWQPEIQNSRAEARPKLEVKTHSIFLVTLSNPLPSMYLWPHTTSPQMVI